jgi:small-conductance mechanosensitive channel
VADPYDACNYLRSRRPGVGLSLSRCSGGGRHRGEHAEPNHVSDRTVEALITAGIGLVVVIAVRFLLGVAFDRYERRLSAKDPMLAARRRTTLGFLRRVVVALVAALAVWKVLSLYPSTDQLMNALLASSAVLAIFVGLAFNTPLSNLGSGMLVAFAQPLRIGDRVTVGDQTGFVEEMDLLYTTLVTDDARRVFIPNSQLTATMIVNRTIRDPRRVVSASLPVRLGAPIHEARATALGALEGVRGLHRGEAKVLVGEVSGNAVWLTAMASAPLDADVIQLGSDVREAVLGALGDAGYLAA